MAIRTYKVTLDSKNTIAPEPVFLRQGDKTGAVVIDATLMDNGSPVSLDGLTPMFKANTADGQAVIADSTGFSILDSVNGEFTYQVPNALSAVPGKIMTAYFSLSDASGSESTFDVVFIIKKAVDATQAQADEYITIIDGTLKSLQQKIDAMNTDVQTILDAFSQGDFYNKAQTDAKDADLQNQINTNKTSITTTGSRIDSLIANVGNGTVPSELIDMRVAYDGITYSTSGEAVRGQVSTIDSKIKSVLNVNSNLAVSWSQGGLTIDGVAEVDSSKRLRSELLEAHPGTTITCTNKQYCFIVYLFDKNKKYKKPLLSDLAANAHRYTFVVPEGVYFLRLVISSSKLLENNDSVDIGLNAAESIVIDQVINQESTTGFETAEFVFGAIDNGGNYLTTQNRLRSVFVRAKKGDRIRLTDKLKYEYRVIEYLSNVNQSFFDASDTTFNVEDYIVKNDRCTYVRVVLKRVDNADFENVDEGSRILFPKNDSKYEELIRPSSVPQSSFSAKNLLYDDRSAQNYDKIIERYDDLVNKHPDYVKKTLLGKDQSSTQDIYCYEFKAKQLGVSGTPAGTSYNPNNIPTIILDGGLHGFEKPIVLAILNAMQKITEDWLEDEILSWLHLNFRILVIPVCNPWGYVNDKRTNSRQVDLNRNFDVLNYWERGDDNTVNDRYRGEAPLSEVESQYINQLLKSNKETAWLYLNFHTYGMGNSYQTMTSYEVMPIIPTDKIVLSLIELVKITTQSAWKNHGLPLNSGYIGSVGSDELGAMAVGQANVYGIPSAVPEGTYKFYGQHNDWSTEVNCLDTEIVINSILIPIRKLYFSN